MARKRPIYVMFFTELTGLYLLFFRYLLSVQIQSVRMACYTIQQVGTRYETVFSPDLLPGALLPFLPSLLLLTAGFVLSVTATLKGWLCRLTPLQGMAVGFSTGGCTPHY